MNNTVRRHQPLRLALFYLAFGIAWIISSDWLLAELAKQDMWFVEIAQTFKGICFVLLSALLIFVIARHYDRQNKGALERSNALYLQYKGLYETISEGVIDYDFQSDQACINPVLMELLGYGQSLIPCFMQEHHSRIHPDDRSEVQRQSKEMFASGQSSWQMEYRYRVHDGNYRTVVSRGYFLRHSQTGEVVRYIGTLNDISELRTLKSQFLAQELRHRQETGRLIIEAQEEERNRWALELHDNVCQLLTVVKLYLGQVRLQQADPFLEKASAIVVDVLNEIRQLSFTMKPPQFNGSNLRESLDVLLTNMHSAGKLQIHTDFDGLAERHLNDEHRLLVYRVVQEQLNNIVKHSRAEQVVVQLSNSEQKMEIKVADNGVGFEPKSKVTGIGLRNIQNRLEIFAGNLLLHSLPGAGCELKATFHLK